MVTSKAVFLDKDGTLIEDVPYNVDPELIRLTDGAIEGLRLLQEAGYRLIVVTNQSGIARGFFTEEDLARVRKRLEEILAGHSIALTDFYYCPHLPEGSVPEYVGTCFCRKPQPGMLFHAALQHKINLAESWLVGDILHDIEAGNRAGCRTVLLDNQHETEWNFSPIRKPTLVANQLEEVAHAILQA